MTDVKPFVRSSASTANIMALVIISLLPSVAAGIFRYGARAALLTGIAVLTAVVSELVFELIAGRPVTILDYSAALSGLILGLILPPSVPLYYPAIGAAVAILAIKMPFGGIGKNILNPAAAGKLVLLIAFNSQMSNYSIGSYDSLPPLTQVMNGNTVSLHDLLTGNVAGCIGTACAVTILFAALLLIVTGVGGILIPFFTLASFALVIIFFGGSGWDPTWLSVQMIGGSMLFTAFIMAQDYTTSPVTIKGKILYGIGIGVLAAILRLTVSTEDAALFALLFMNLTVRFIDAHTMPKPFGTVQRERQIREIETRRKAAAAARKAREEAIRAKQEEELRREEENEPEMQEASSRENNLSSDTTMLRPEEVRKALDGIKKTADRTKKTEDRTKKSADTTDRAPEEEKSDDLEMVYLEDEPDADGKNPADPEDKDRQ
jgi:electron transport complex protein RnfD